MMHVRSFLVLIAGLALAAPAAMAGGADTLDFDVAQTRVANRVAGGHVEVTSQTKIEALADGDIVSESAFFFPASPETIASQLAEPAGVCRLAAFCKGAERLGATPDGKGWVGEMTVSAASAKASPLRGGWTRELGEAARRHGEYKIRFEVRSEARPSMTTLTFNLLEGKIFQRLDVTVNVYKGAPASTLIVIQARSRSTLAPTVADRVSLAKRIVRDSAGMLDKALTGR